MKVTIVFLLAAFGASGSTPGGETNAWVQVSEDAVGPRQSPGLVWSERLGRFVLLAGAVSHQFQGQRPYDAKRGLTYDSIDRQRYTDCREGPNPAAPCGPTQAGVLPLPGNLQKENVMSQLRAVALVLIAAHLCCADLNAAELPLGALRHDGPPTPEQISLYLPVTGRLDSSATAWP